MSGAKGGGPAIIGEQFCYNAIVRRAPCRLDDSQLWTGSAGCVGRKLQRDRSEVAIADPIRATALA